MSRFSVRSTAPELMDDLTDPVDYAACLGDLARVNRLTRTHAPVLAWLARVTRGRESFRLLDVACGHGDLLRAIHRWAARRGLRAELEGIDLNPGSAVAASAATPAGVSIAWRTGDVFAFHPDPRPDFIVSSQFTHHLDDVHVRAFLQWTALNARAGWFIADLHRHPLAYYGFKALSWAAGWHPIVRHDGLVSVLRGFKRRDLKTAAEGLPVSIRWRIPFRYSIEST